ncbi:MAG: hypothetical protein NC337_03445 [Roseburia sp.]|nr:hypothetical protein [Roseburia sp.]
MKFIIISIIFAGIISLKLKRENSREAKAEQSFWEREAKANYTRRKSLDALDYITIPDDILSMSPENMTEAIRCDLEDLKSLSAYKIVNLTGLSNTDLKLQYGTANITILSEYDFHYTNLVTLLQRLAEKLHANGNDTLAIRTLEFAVSTGTDVGKSYYLLSELYAQYGTPEKIDGLIRSAQSLRSLTKDTIVQNLQAGHQ